MSFGLLVLLTTVHAQSSEEQLAKADSLFKLRKYTQSFELYSTLFAEKKYSPAMLLRMAFIEEGLAHYANAMYYLNLYYLHTYDGVAQEKIRQLATGQYLSGYELSDMDRFAEAWQRYGYIVTAVLAVVAVVFTALLLVTRRKETKTLLWICQSVVLAMFLVHLHFPFAKKAIVCDGTTFLMTGPSAGASVVAKVGGGHRVTMYGKTDVWVKIGWQGKKVFVRESSLKPLER